MDTEMNSLPIGFGLPQEWQAFISSNPVVISKLQLLLKTLEKTFIRTHTSSPAAGTVVFYLGRLCVEDFMEILLLCGNGYGIGGLKLLRGMYEKAVTAAFISKNPSEADTFLDYHFVHQRKSLNHIRGIFSADQLKEFVSDAEMAEIMENSDNVRDQFRETLCAECGTTRDRFSWSKLDLASMARAVGNGFEKLYFPCYYRPTLQSHTTVSALVERLVMRDDNDSITFHEGAQRKAAREAVLLAHHVTLLVVATQNQHFSLGLDNEIEERIADFKEAWAPSE